MVVSLRCPCHHRAPSPVGVQASREATGTQRATSSEDTEETCLTQLGTHVKRLPGVRLKGKGGRAGGSTEGRASIKKCNYSSQLKRSVLIS